MIAQFIRDFIKAATIREPKWEGFPLIVTKLDRYLTANQIITLHVMVTSSTRNSFLATGSILGCEFPKLHYVSIHGLQNQISVKINDLPRKVFTVMSASEEDLQPVIMYLQDFHSDFMRKANERNK